MLRWAAEPVMTVVAPPLTTVFRRGAGMLSRAGNLLTALVSFALGGILAWNYPLGQFAAPVLFLAATALAFHRPAWFLVIIPALLPVIGLAPWTGWITFEEMDLLVLATASGGYARALVDGTQAGSGRRPWLLIGLSALMTLSILISMARGFSDAGGFVFGWYQGYDGPMNSIRIGKSFILALLLVPLINRLQRESGNQVDTEAGLGSGARSGSPLHWRRFGSAWPLPICSISPAIIGQPRCSGRCTSAAQRSTAGCC